MSYPMLGKVSVISQGFTSVGASLAKQLAANGSNIILLHTATTRSGAELLVAEINTKGRGIALLAEVDFPALCTSSGELSSDDHNNINAKLYETLKLFARVDVLVHADESVQARTLVEVDEEYFDEMVRTNVKEPLFLTKLIAPYMQQGGRVIFLSTYCTQVTSILPKGLVYTAMKGAIQQVVRVLANDLGQRGITVNAIAMGPIDTPIFRAGKTPEEMKRIGTLGPYHRMAHVDEIVPTILFLSTPESQWVNGQTIPVNGGYVV